jgi:hypothetical protein
VAIPRFSKLMSRESTIRAKHEHYLRNKGRYVKQSLDKKVKLKAIIDEAKSVPCRDCGFRYPPYVMDFDHISGTKIMDVSKLTRFGSERKLREEIAKCEVVCSNCHRERTHKRGLGIMAVP